MLFQEMIYWKLYRVLERNRENSNVLNKDEYTAIVIGLFMNIGYHLRGDRSCGV